MRHVLVPVQLINEARAATPPRALTDAPADEPEVRVRRRRFASRTRRTRTA
jgi:hypothetical protein